MKEAIGKRKTFWIDMSFLVIGFMINIIFLFKYGKRILDSDMSSEMILSKILNDEHAILSKSWLYSSEIRILQMQWFYRIGLVFSPDNWFRARCIGMVLALIVFTWVIWFVFYAVYEDKERGILPTAMCLMPCGSWYFWQTLYGGYYMPYIMIGCLTVALTILISKYPERISSKVYLVILILVGIASGLNGVKQLMVFYAPFVIASFCMLLYAVRQKDNEKFHIYAFIVSVISAASSATGYLINMKVLAKNYIFEKHEDVKIVGNGIWEYVRYYWWSFGFQNEQPMMSFAGISSFLGLFIGGMVFVCGIRLVVRFAELNAFEKYITAYSIISILFSILVFTYLENGAIQYYQPVVPCGLFLIGIELKTEKLTYEKSRNLLVCAFMAIMLIVSIGTLKSEFYGPLHDMRKREGMEKVVKFLVNTGHTRGVGTFWNGNLLTELSNGDIEMWPIRNVDADVITWLQWVSHDSNLPTEDYFFVCKKVEDVSLFLERHPELSLIYDDNDFLVYACE